MSTRILRSVLLAAFAVTAAACGSSEPTPADDHTAHPADAADAPATTAGGRRVFFVQPKDGDTIGTMAAFEFGVENVTIGAVPPGELTEADVRDGILHHHLGVNTECLAPGMVIPKAEPWIHFGDGKNVIEMALTPGEYKFALLAGDDLHRAIDGLCEVITVTVK